MKRFNLKHIPLLFLVGYLIRSLITNQVSLNEVILCAILSGLTAFYELRLEAKVATQIKEDQEKITISLKEEIKRLSENDFRQEMILQELRNAMSGINVNAGLRGLVKK